LHLGVAAVVGAVGSAAGVVSCTVSACAIAAAKNTEIAAAANGAARPKKLP